MRLAIGTTVLATVAGCGSAKKTDPYAASLAKGSEHVEIRGTVRGQLITASGDFTNQTGHLTILNTTGGRFEEVVAGHRIYVKQGGAWMSATSPAFLTPAQIFRKRLPATFENGLVKRVTLTSAQGRETITFSRYGEHVSVTVPSTKGS